MILHPVRMRLILALNSRTLTPKQLAAELQDVALATLYHHLNLLTEAGITRVVEERLVRGALCEKLYMLPDASDLLNSEEIASASKDELQQCFLAFVCKLIGDHARYLDLQAGRYYTDAGYHQHPLHLSDEEFAQSSRRSTPPCCPGLNKNLLLVAADICSPLLSFLNWNGKGPKTMRTTPSASLEREK